MKIVAIIPARKGSKGLKGKNLALLAGSPLIEYTIDAALKSKSIEKVYVSSDCEDILNTSKKCGALTIKRPEHLSADNSSSESVVIHALNSIDSSVHTHFMLLQPTSPLRNHNHIDQAAEILKKRPDCNNLISITKSRHSPYKDLKIANDKIEPLFSAETLSTRRQDLPETYSQNGAIYLQSISSFLKTKSFYTKQTAPFIMDPKHSIDIDYMDDLKEAAKRITQHNDDMLRMQKMDF